MALFDISREELQGILGELEQALYNHRQWYGGLTRTLICRLPPDRHDVNPEAHRDCRFGQWYYGEIPGKLREHPGYIAIGAEHQRMHELATRLLVEATTGNPVSPQDYDLYYNAIERMQLEIFALQHELENLLHDLDPLTRTFTRVTMLPVLREQQELAKRLDQPSCIVMMDLDHFKRINDREGHGAGDQVLAAVARFIMKSLRPYDKVFRYGGEEFLLCMQHTDARAGYALVERLREGLAATAIDIGRREPVHMTASFGVAPLDPNVPVEQSIFRADKAMYAAKSAGRNCTRTWEQSA